MAKQKTTPRSIILIEPSLPNLSGFEDALAKGWSPDPRRQTDRAYVEAELVTLRHDRAGFLTRLTSGDVIATSVSDREPQRLVLRPFWIWDGEFCGYITFRHMPRTGLLPLHLPGHVGYSIVPWKQGRGYATQALRLLLPIAAQAGFERISVICNEDNLASRRVIEKAGGLLHHAGPDPSDGPDTIKLFFWLATGSGL
ncbi:GNAT family N-acetyltransferase [Rhizobium sp. ICMP 5592]|uniref:GNAT family N-acetyltransferase n=1 Tax=Rhizobium sp. ICMP 5592 TaxID=2292445 RepID=UPI001294F5B6|nr:GNAT family N-acetyltransferase [Rhizobium sp. ICMP 5592]MQB45250.1 GNAT family N-acetyltransferase [Rhizobium sp. ICMP 5592]